MKCENCTYYDFTEDVEYEHCCFNEWGHADTEVAPCDDPDFDDDYEEPDDIDSDLGYDPYAGCYTYDC